MSQARRSKVNGRLLSQIDQRILDHYLRIDGSGNLISSPKTDDELFEFIELAFDVSIPRKAITPGHRAPFDFIADLFFERVMNALAFANRSGGKTWNVAVLNMLDMVFKKGCEIASAGAVQSQAKKAYSYFQGFMDLPWFKDLCARYEKATGNPFVRKAIREETVFANGSEQEIITATQKGLRSPHPHKARIDEVDEIDWDILQTGLSMARSEGGVKGQNVFTSTRQFEYGSMQRLLDEAHEKGIDVYEWNVWETIERCTRRCIDDPVHGTCPIFTFCKGKAHQCDGFIEIEDFIGKARLIDREKFETEWLNKKPARDKLVYYMFDTTRHVMTPDRLFRMTGVAQPSSYWNRVSGIDFGSSPGHPFVYLKVCQLPTGAWLVFHEYVAEQRLMRDHSGAIKSSPWWTKGERIFADHAAQERLELKMLGVRTRQAEKSVLVGIDYISSLLRGFPPKEDPMLYVWHECQSTIRKFGLYRWPLRQDGRADRSGKPMKKDDDELDALRYALYSNRKAPTHKYRSRKVRL